MRLNTFHIVLLLFFLIGCKKDAQVLPKKYPYIVMRTVNIDEFGVEFKAEVQELGNSPIISYGFKWIKGSDSFSKEINNELGIGDFSLKVTSDLIKDESYTVRPFVRTKDYLVYGNQLSFKSKGSKAPKISSFEPNKGNSGDTVIIYGENFSVLKSRINVTLGTDIVDVISTDFNEIKFVVPQTLSISGDVPIYVKSGEKLIQSNDLFSINGQRISDFNPKEGMIGETEVEISGRGFNPTKTTVWFGDYKAEILNISETSIKVRLPYYMNTGMNLVKVDIDGRKAISSSSFQVKSRWTKLNDFPGTPRLSGACKVIGNYAYLLTDDFWRWDLINNKWEKLDNFPGKKRYDAVIFEINGELYYGLGLLNYEGLTDFWKYNIQTNTWTQLNNFPGEGRCGSPHFSLNNKGYLIGGYYTTIAGDSNDVWQYEPSSDKWTKLGNSTAAYLLDGRDVFFQTSDRAYIVPITFRYTAAMVIYEFDPNAADFLVSQSISLPNSLQDDSFPAFVLDNNLYILSTYNCVFWKYDFSNSSWTRLENFPGGSRLYTNSFSYNGAAFVLMGSRLGSDVTSPDIWTYVPR